MVRASHDYFRKSKARHVSLTCAVKLSLDRQNYYQAIVPAHESATSFPMAKKIQILGSVDPNRDFKMYSLLIFELPKRCFQHQLFGTCFR